MNYFAAWNGYTARKEVGELQDLYCTRCISSEECPHSLIGELLSRSTIFFIPSGKIIVVSVIMREFLLLQNPLYNALFSTFERKMDALIMTLITFIFSLTENEIMLNGHLVPSLWVCGMV